jgi:hypothetical protein
VNMRGVPFTPTRPEQSEHLYPGRYVEHVRDARTTAGDVFDDPVN